MCTLSQWRVGLRTETNNFLIARPNPAVASATDTSLRINPPGPSNNNLRAAPPGEAASDYTAVQMPASFLPSIESQQQYGGYNSDREELQMRIQHTVKLWSCFLLLIYGMFFLSAVSAYSADTTAGAANPAAEGHEDDAEYLSHLAEWQKDRSTDVVLMIFISAYGCYAGYIGLKAAARMDIHSMRMFTRSLVRLAIFSVGRAVFEVMRKMDKETFYIMRISPEGKSELIECGAPGLPDCDKNLIVHMAMVSAGITCMMWFICVHRAMQLQMLVDQQGQTLRAPVR